MKTVIDWPAREAARFLAVTGLVLTLNLLAGCSGFKGKYAGKLTVKTSPKLENLGVTLKDWRYSESDTTFGVQLSASKEFGLPNKIEVWIEGRGTFSSPVPVSLKAGETQWIGFGGTKALGNPFADLPENGTITIDVR